MTSAARQAGFIRLLVVAALAVALVASTSATASAKTQERFTRPLDSAQVVPGPGDPDGSGGVFIFLDRQDGRFCVFVNTTNVSTPFISVDLHRAPEGEVGSVVVEVFGPTTDPDPSRCMDLDRKLVKDISKHKEDYYIDIHNDEFPGGAIRGQLG